MAKQMPPDNMAELMEKAEERKSEYLRDWLKDPAFRAALHRYDAEVLKRTRRLMYA